MSLVRVSPPHVQQPGTNWSRAQVSNPGPAVVGQECRVVRKPGSASRGKPPRRIVSFHTPATRDGHSSIQAASLPTSGSEESSPYSWRSPHPNPSHIAILKLSEQIPSFLHWALWAQSLGSALRASLPVALPNRTVIICFHAHLPPQTVSSLGTESTLPPLCP